MKIRGLLGEFDGAQRLHAGVHVEGFTGPAVGGFAALAECLT